MKTPEAKAEELIIKYKDATIGMYAEINRITALKKCALIAVDEISRELIRFGGETDELQNMDRLIDYWQKVAQDIIKHGK